MKGFLSEVFRFEERIHEVYKKTEYHEPEQGKLNHLLTGFLAEALTSRRVGARDRKEDHGSSKTRYIPHIEAPILSKPTDVLIPAAGHMLVKSACAGIRKA